MSIRNTLGRGKAAQVQSFTVPAGRHRTFKATGRHFYLVESPIRLTCRIEGGGTAVLAAGTGVSCEGESFFEWVEILNPSTADVRVTVYAGFAEYKDRRTSVMEPETHIRGGTGLIAAGATIDLSAVLQGLEVRRKLITLSNGSIELRLLVRDASGNSCIPIFPESSIQVPVSGPIFLHNPHGVAVEYFWSEVYWMG